MTASDTPEPTKPRQGFIADGYLGSFTQWCAEHPKATAHEVARVASVLLMMADRHDARRVRHGGGRPRKQVSP